MASPRATTQTTDRPASQGLKRDAPLPTPQSSTVPGTDCVASCTGLLAEASYPRGPWGHSLFLSTCSEGGLGGCGEAPFSPHSSLSVRATRTHFTRGKTKALVRGWT